MIFRLTEIDSKVLLILDFAWLGLTHISGDENVCSILLSETSQVRFLSGTPQTPLKALFYKVFSGVWFMAFYLWWIWIVLISHFFIRYYFKPFKEVDLLTLLKFYLWSVCFKNCSFISGDKDLISSNNAISLSVLKVNHLPWLLALFEMFEHSTLFACFLEF